MNIAIVGTGYVAEMYGTTLAHHPELNLVGAYDTESATLPRSLAVGRPIVQ